MSSVSGCMFSTERSEAESLKSLGHGEGSVLRVTH
jgi:hypothetical protein